MSPREFERLIAELYEIEGYNVKLTQQTRDGGKDLIVSKQGITGNHLYYIECKRYAQSNHVSVDVVDRLYGNVMADRVTAGIVVTSSSFTRQAINRSKEMKYQMTLVDHDDLGRLINKATAFISK
jgi:HJR/Mrr/RecB family endonuclease